MRGLYRSVQSSQNACDIAMIQLYPLNLRKHIHASIWAIAILIYHHYHHLVSLAALQAMEIVQHLEIYTPNNNRIMLRHYAILYFLIRDDQPDIEEKDYISSGPIIFWPTRLQWTAICTEHLCLCLPDTATDTILLPIGTVVQVLLTDGSDFAMQQATPGLHHTSGLILICSQCMLVNQSRDDVIITDLNDNQMIVEHVQYGVF